MYRGKGSAGWREIGGKRIYCRSRWEANVARWLEYQKEKGLIIDWMHEPKTFWFPGIKRGCVSYKPDFWVMLNDAEDFTASEWIEVKGWMDAKSNTKIKRFKKYFPREKLRVLDKEWFKQNSAKLKLIIKDWEASSAPQKRQVTRNRFIQYSRDDKIRASESSGSSGIFGNSPAIGCEN